MRRAVAQVRHSAMDEEVPLTPKGSPRSIRSSPSTTSSPPRRRKRPRPWGCCSRTSAVIAHHFHQEDVCGRIIRKCQSCFETIGPPGAGANSSYLPTLGRRRATQRRLGLRGQMFIFGGLSLFVTCCWFLVSSSSMRPQPFSGILTPSWTTFRDLRSLYLGEAKRLMPLSEVSRVVQRFSDEGLRPVQRPRDLTQYTVRINTWQRQEQLQLSVAHHAQCPGVAEIQIVWCLAQGLVPDWLLDLEQRFNRSEGGPGVVEGTTTRSSASSSPRIVIERHVNNNLNERFRVLSEPPTLGILSVDDDVLRPCLALDAAFDRWTYNPDRMVGFDARTIVVRPHHNVTDTSSSSSSSSSSPWSYSYMSTTAHANQYALTLTRYCFLHVDYLHSYMNDMPAVLRDVVARSLNCEDLAMSLWVSRLTGGQVPLLADYWAVQSQIKLYNVDGGISLDHQSQHKAMRDTCVDQFATWLGLKESAAGGNQGDVPLRTPLMQWAKLRHGRSSSNPGGLFTYGATDATDWNHHERSERLQRSVVATLTRWKKDPKAMRNELVDLRGEAMAPAYQRGLIEKSGPWRERFQHQQLEKDQDQQGDESGDDGTESPTNTA